MIRIYFFLVLFVVASSAVAQERNAIRVYKVGNKLFTRDALGGTPTTNPFVNTSVDATNTLIQLTIDKLVRYYTPDKFLDTNGSPWGLTVIDAVTAFQNAASTVLTTSVGTISAATYDEAVAKTSGLGVAAIVKVAADNSPGNAGNGPQGGNPATKYVYFPGDGLQQLVIYPY